MENEKNFRDMLVEMNKCLQCDVMQVANGSQDLKLPKFQMNNLLNLIFEVKNIFQKEPILLTISSPIVVIGDLHGHFLDLIRILQIYGLPITKQLLFLGDFVDRGEFSIETIVYIYLLKYHFPDNVKIIRGNHEFEYICSTSGFLNEINCFYGEPQLFYAFMESFSYFPIAAIIDNSILAVHGGIGPSLTSVDQIKELERPLVEFGDDLLDSLLWSDPSSSAASLGINLTLDSAVPSTNPNKKACKSSSIPEPLPHLGGSDFPISPSLANVPSPFSQESDSQLVPESIENNQPLDGFRPSKRGSGHLFGKDVLKAFLDNNNLTKLIRGHECVQDGILEAFDGLIVTVFSASNYCGSVGNKAAALTIKDRNNFIVKRFPPIPYLRRADAVFPNSEPRKMQRPRAATFSRAANSSRTVPSVPGTDIETIKNENTQSTSTIPAKISNQQNQQQKGKVQNQNQGDVSSLPEKKNNLDQDPNKANKKKPVNYSQLRMKAKSSRITSSALAQSNPVEVPPKPNPIQVSVLPNKNKKQLSPLFPPHPGPSNAISSPSAVLPTPSHFQKPLVQMRAGSGLVLKTNQAPKKLPLRESPPKPMKKKTVICPPMT